VSRAKKSPPRDRRWLIEEYVRRFAAGEISEVLELFTADCCFRMPLREAPIVGKTDLAEFFLSLREEWLRLDESATLILVEGDIGVAELQFAGTLKNQESFSASSVDIFWFAGDSIKEVKVYTDTFPLRRVYQSGS
jgi:ketosteroid isomerase-like protein